MFLDLRKIISRLYDPNASFHTRMYEKQSRADQPLQTRVGRVPEMSSRTEIEMITAPTNTEREMQAGNCELKPAVVVSVAQLHFFERK
jgi:hypothetical protein